MRAAIVLVLVMALGGGCRKSAEREVAPLPAPISVNEADRGVEACRAYVERVCACAQARPGDAELAELCELAPAKLTSLDMVLEVNRESRDVDERLRTETTTRRIVASCIEEQGRLDGRGCPR